MGKTKPLFRPSGFFVQRTPTLPFDVFQGWTTYTERGELHRALRDLITQPLVREALFVASPSTDQEVDRWLANPHDAPAPKLESTLYRYLARMTSRATPFGLFAGCSLGRAAASTKLDVPAALENARHTRLDMDYLLSLAEALGREPIVRDSVRYFPNSSLYETGARLRYAESHFDGRRRDHRLVGIEMTDYLLETLERARPGARRAALAEPLVGDGVTLTEAREYIEELIDSQVLVSELEPPVTGAEPIHHMIAVLERYDATAHLARPLVATRDALAAIDSAGIGQAAERYRAVARELESLPGSVHLPKLLQVDMVKPVSELRLGANVLDEVVRGVELLHRICPATVFDGLDDFRREFTRRYGDREVPLVEALDEESGVGFQRRQGPGASAEPLIEGMAFPPRDEVALAWEPRHDVLLRLLHESWHSGTQAVDLDDETLRALEPRVAADLPPAFAVAATIGARSPEAIDDGDFSILLAGLSGPSGARQLGRFCHADPELCQEVETHLREEEALAPETIFAEVVHLPEGRVGNILSRPVLREYEIPFLGRSGAPEEHQLPISDLMVSVRRGRVTLRSRRLDREVVPRLTSAHNFGAVTNLRAYGFLCTLQYQGVLGGLRWSWGPLEQSPFLPRVTCGRLVLSRARWRISADVLLRPGGTDCNDPHTQVQSWRRSRRIPRFVCIAEGDNELLIDLDNVVAVDTLVTMLRKQRALSLVEFFPAPAELCARGPEGAFVHELVMPMVRTPVTEADDNGKQAVASAPHGRADRLHPAVQAEHTIAPRRDWLYLNLFAGTSTVDQLLRELVGPVVRPAIASGAADSWFFIRYNDPEWHLRLRMRGDPERLHGEVYPAIAAASSEFMRAGLISRLQVDTYQREIHRYGGPEAMLLSEELFCADSDAALSIVEALAGDVDADRRWQLALRGLHELLGDFGFDLEERRGLCLRARDALAAEFRFDARTYKQLGTRYREARADVESILTRPPVATDPLVAVGVEAIEARARRVRAIASKLAALEEGGRLTLSMGSLVQSYMHMQVNRMLRSSHRAQELVLYDFLAQFYRSAIARKRNAGGRSSTNDASTLVTR